MGVNHISLQRCAKGSVSIRPYKNGLRIRWRNQGKRLEIYVPPSVPDFRTTANTIATIIERDLIVNQVDESLKSYKALLELTAAFPELEVVQQQKPSRPIYGHRDEPQSLKGYEDFEVLKKFDRYITLKTSSDVPNYYFYTRRMLERWGTFELEDVPILLRKEKFSPRTFNDRRNCLFKFFDWLVKKKMIGENPLAEVSTKRKGKVTERRDPFTDSEAAAILEAIRTDRFKPKSSGYTHSQYYPFVAFLLQTGARNGEALGLQVQDVCFERSEIRIAKSFSRTKKGTHNSARVLKGTKTGNERFIPMDDYLHDLLKPLCQGRAHSEHVFVNQRGNPIDDRKVLHNVFRPVMKALGIRKRDLYTCRHTFATRAIQQGMNADQVAYIMGDSLETVLSNYFHNNRKPTSLPKPVVRAALSIAV